MDRQNTGLPIFLLTNNHPEKFFEKATYQYAPQSVTNIDKLKRVFFSPENIKYIQEKMIYEVSTSTNNKYKIPYQNERDLRMIMESIYYEKTRNVGFDLNEQLAELNNYVVKFCVPRIIKEIGFYLKYLEDVETPMKLNTLPESSANLRSVSALTSQSYLNENIYLPNMASTYYYSTNGDLNNLTPEIQTELDTRITSYNSQLPPRSSNMVLGENFDSLSGTEEHFASKAASKYAFGWDDAKKNTKKNSNLSKEDPKDSKVKKETKTVKEMNESQYVWGAPSDKSRDPRSPPVSSNNWLPSAILFQDDPYYIRNSLLSPYSVKSHYPAKVFPQEDGEVVATAEGSDLFLPNDIDVMKYAKA